MYSTQHGLMDTPPEVDPQSRLGRYLCYPDLTGNRRTEGGLRPAGEYKTRSEKQPLVTVITSAFNAALYIERAICSILTQSYKNIEYVVVDAASTDQTLRILKKYGDAIDYFVSEPDDGVYEGLNKGLELAQGDYILVLNADDWYKEECVETLVREASKGKLDMVSGLAIETDQLGYPIGNIPMMPFRTNVMLRMPLRHETMLVARRLHEKVGLYDTIYKTIADLKFTQDVYRSDANSRQLNRHLMYSRRAGVASEVTEELLSERRLLLRERFDFLSEDEVGILAEEYGKNPAEYAEIAVRHKANREFSQALIMLLGLHGPAFPRALEEAQVVNP